MHVQLYLRLDPLAVVQQDVAMPALQHLLAKGSVTRDTDAFEAILCQAFGVEKQLDWPAAALSWLGEGNAPGDYFWLYADPVNLQLQRDHFSLNVPAPMPMTKAESTALCESLNQHFGEDGFVFCIGASGQWYLRQAVPSAIITSFPAQAVGRNIRNFLPQGASSEKWLGVLNEIQMLLHEHRVNRAREEQGEPVINSLWLSGAGSIPSQAHVSPKTIFANNPLAKGLALWTGSKAFPLSSNFTFSDNQEVLLVLDEMHNPAQWSEQMLAALRTGKVKQLTLDIFIQHQHVRAAVKRSDLLKFWRKPQPLISYLSW